MGRKLKIEIYHDPDAENPCDGDGWKLYSFSTRHNSYKDPHEFFPLSVLDIGLRRKMDVGLAYVLSYFEHGNCRWMLRDAPKGMMAGDWRWDGVDTAGMLIWEEAPKNLGPKSKDDRKADAEAFLETYTAWCNGETYGYEITEEDGGTVDSCGGCIGTDHLFQVIFGEVEGGDEIVSVESELGFTLDDVAGRRKELAARK